MPPKIHVHTYVRAIGRRTDNNKDSGMLSYYKCADPDCSHYVRAELVLGKKSICNRCGKEFTLPISIRFLGMRPHCKRCTKKQISRVELDKALDEMIDEVVDVVD